MNIISVGTVFSDNGAIANSTKLSVRKQVSFSYLYVLNLYYENISNTRAGTQCAFIGKKGQRVASRYHRYYTITLETVHCCRLELAFLLHTAVHTTCSHFRVKYRWRNFFRSGKYSSNKFSDNVPSQNISL